MVQNRGGSDAGRAMDGLRRLVRAVRASNREIERSVGISASQIFILQALDAPPQPSLEDLAERTLTSTATLSEMVERLAAAGLVSFGAAAGTGRRELSLTGAGRSLCRRAPTPVQNILAEALRHLPAEQRRSLADGLEAWVAASHLAELPATMLFESPHPSTPRRLALRWRRSLRRT